MFHSTPGPPMHVARAGRRSDRVQPVLVQHQLPDLDVRIEVPAHSSMAGPHFCDAPELRPLVCGTSLQPPLLPDEGCHVCAGRGYARHMPARCHCECHTPASMRIVEELTEDGGPAGEASGLKLWRAASEGHFDRVQYLLRGFGDDILSETRKDLFNSLEGFQQFKRGVTPGCRNVGRERGGGDVVA
ncbi:unnamed protein product [Durusdinium trenchii]|uniref:Uncharacterized protein n=1 Tax=Durusdinium trenchii TaxID=1381693 RepID=A0ABP0RDZ3_9DINO